MSILARQSIKYGLVGYFSTFLGMLATIILYPKNLAFAGKLQFIFQTALLLIPVFALGITYANVKFYPKMEASNNGQNLLKFSLFFILRNFVFISVFVFILVQIFPKINSHQWIQLAIFIFPISLILAIIQLLSKYISIKKRIVVPNLFENVFPKIGIIAAFIAVTFYSFQQKNGFILFFSVVLLAFFGLVFYLNNLEKLIQKTNFHFLKENHFKKELLQFTTFTFLGSLGSQIALNIDTFIIGEALQFDQVAIYNTSLNVVRMITVPALGVYTISAPIIAKLISENKWIELNEMHQKTSLYLFVLGSVLFGLVAVGISDLFLLLSNTNELSKGLPIVYIMGFAFLFDLATGFNGYIITNSKYFQVNNYLTIGLAILTIITNLLFIYVFKAGIVGVCLATAISLTTYNVIKIIFNYQKFKIHPFTFSFLKMLFLLFVVLSIGYILPNTTNLFFNFCYKPTIAFCIFILGNYFLKIIDFKLIFSKNLFKN